MGRRSRNFRGTTEGLTHGFFPYTFDLGQSGMLWSGGRNRQGVHIKREAINPLYYNHLSYGQRRRGHRIPEFAVHEYLAVRR
jgi:hypothetical protein